MVAVVTSWNQNAHEQGWHRRQVGQSLATIALNVLQSSIRHWQLAVAKNNLKFLANSAATCFHRTRMQMIGFHAWCQNTAERCRMRANQQTVLRALRLASENVPAFSTSKGHDKASLPLFVAHFKAPWCGLMVSALSGKVVHTMSCRAIANGDARSESNAEVLEHVSHCPPMQQQQNSLASAKGVMLQCAFGLRFSATADDVSWAANIRRFVDKPFDDPLFNSIVVQGIRFVQQPDSTIPCIPVLQRLYPSADHTALSHCPVHKEAAPQICCSLAVHQ